MKSGISMEILVQQFREGWNVSVMRKDNDKSYEQNANETQQTVSFKDEESIIEFMKLWKRCETNKEREKLIKSYRGKCPQASDYVRDPKNPWQWICVDKLA